MLKHCLTTLYETHSEIYKHMKMFCIMVSISQTLKLALLKFKRSLVYSFEVVVDRNKLLLWYTQVYLYLKNTTFSSIPVFENVIIVL